MFKRKISEIAILYVIWNFWGVSKTSHLWNYQSAVWYINKQNIHIPISSDKQLACRRPIWSVLRHTIDQHLWLKKKKQTKTEWLILSLRQCNLNVWSSAICARAPITNVHQIRKACEARMLSHTELSDINYIITYYWERRWDDDKADVCVFQMKAISPVAVWRWTGINNNQFYYLAFIATWDIAV